MSAGIGPGRVSSNRRPGLRLVQLLALLLYEHLQYHSAGTASFPWLCVSRCEQAAIHLTIAVAICLPLPTTAWTGISRSLHLGPRGDR